MFSVFEYRKQDIQSEGALSNRNSSITKKKCVLSHLLTFQLYSNNKLTYDIVPVTFLSLSLVINRGNRAGVTTLAVFKKYTILKGEWTIIKKKMKRKSDL